MRRFDASAFWVPMRRSLGDKRREIPLDRMQEIVALLRRFEEGEHVKIFPTTHFGVRKITVERPLRLNFSTSPARLARLSEEPAFRNLAVSRKKGGAKAKEEAEGRAQQEALLARLRTLPDTLYKAREEFEAALAEACHKAGLTHGADPEGDPLRPLRARPDGGDLP